MSEKIYTKEDLLSFAEFSHNSGALTLGDCFYEWKVNKVKVSELPEFKKKILLVLDEIIKVIKEDEA